MSLCHKSLEKITMRVAAFSVLEDHWELIQHWILLKGRFLQREVPHEMSSLGMEKLLALGCSFYEMYLDWPEWAVNETWSELALQGSFSQSGQPPRLHSSVWIHLLENQDCLDNPLQSCLYWSFGCYGWPFTVCLMTLWESGKTSNHS